MSLDRRRLRAGPRSFLALLAGLSLVAAPRAARAQLPACQPGEPEVRALKFNGNSALRDDDLSQIIAGFRGKGYSVVTPNPLTG